MAIINKIDNTASVTYNGTAVPSNAVTTALDLPPTILKAVDKLIASVGDTLTYTITITNVSLQAMNNITFDDTIADGAQYVVDSLTLNGTAVTPVITDQKIEYVIPSIAALEVATLVFQVTIIGGTN